MKLTALIFLALLSLSGCTKEELLVPVTENSNKFRLLVNVSQESVTDTIVHALVTITDGSNKDIVSNERLTMTRNSNSLSGEIELPSGNYKITRFVMLSKNNVSTHASPISNSEKAALVQKPLAVSFSLPNPSTLEIPLDVLKIQVPDEEESFGYPKGTFSKQHADTPGLFKIKLQALISVGSINYDNIPANFSIISRDLEGHLHRKDTLLAAGVNEILLPESHIEFQFKMSKWGISDETKLSRSQIIEGTVYVLGGNKPAKMLSREESFTFAAGAYQPSGKIIYSYHPDRKLKRAVYYQKLPQHSELQVTGGRTYQYSGNNVTKAIRFNAEEIETGYTTFKYNLQQSRVMEMYEKSYDQETSARVNYTNLPSSTLININYQFDNGKGMEYKMKIFRGNKIEDDAKATNGGETGNYTYDTNINPYIHMNVPDMYLSNLSKNNLISRQKNFSGNLPSAEPYKHEFVYDSDGYPKEKITTYKNYLTGEDLYKVKTMFYYD